MLVLAAVCCLGFAIPTASAQQESGLSGLHSKKRVGRKLCFATHAHAGYGTGRTKRAAHRGAIRSWTGFTKWEYGNVWGKWSRASAKSKDCEEINDDKWRCEVSALPCYYKNMKRKKRRKKRRRRRRISSR